MLPRRLLSVGGPTTVLEAVQLLEREGYTATVTVGDDGTIRCGSCRESCPLENAPVDRVYRFEGTSDPDDEAIVLGLRCPGCDAKATLAMPFGPTADPKLLQGLVLLDRRFREQ
jgi:hypothetical protein